MRKFKVNDRVVVVAPGANDGECYEHWMGAVGTVDFVDDEFVDTNLPYRVVFDEVVHGGDTMREWSWWRSEDELDFENEITAQSPDVDDLL